jgi:N-acetylneuraminate synthase
LVARKDIKEGQVLSSVDMTWKRPAAGISPRCIADAIGKKAVRDIKADEVLTWGMLHD